MIFQIFRTSGLVPSIKTLSYHIDDTCKEYIDINKVEDLLKIIKKTKAKIIIGVQNEQPVIEIYDSYRE